MTDYTDSTTPTYVSVSVTPETRRKLRLQKAETGETYDETLNRLLNARGDGR